MKIRIIITILLGALLISINAHADQSQKNAQTDIPDTLQVHKSDVTRTEYEGAIEHLQGLESFIRDSKTVVDIVDSSRFYIGYPNSLLRIKGYVLYLEMELAKAQYESGELKMKAGKISKQNLETLKIKLIKADQAFRDFLKSSSFAD